MWTRRRALSPAAVCVSAGHMTSAWLSRSPPPWIPRGEKVIAIIALPWHGAEHPEVRGKGSLKWWCVRINKEGLICVAQHNGELCRAYSVHCVNEWRYIVSAQADFCVNYSPFVSRDSLSDSDAGAQDEDKCLCIILYSHDGMSDIVPVPSLVQNGCSRPPDAVAPPHLAQDTGNTNLCIINGTKLATWKTPLFFLIALIVLRRCSCFLKGLIKLHESHAQC